MGRLLSGSRACTRVRVREHLYSDLIRGSVVCRLSRNAYRMRLTRHASRGVRDVSFYRARSYKKRDSRDKSETDADSAEIDLARFASRREIDEGLSDGNIYLTRTRIARCDIFGASVFPHYSNIIDY